MIHLGRKSQFGPDQFILVVTISFWSSSNQFGQTKTILDQPKQFWSHRRTRQCNSELLTFQIAPSNFHAQKARKSVSRGGHICELKQYFLKSQVQKNTMLLHKLFHPILRLVRLRIVRAYSALYALALTHQSGGKSKV